MCRITLILCAASFLTAPGSVGQVDRAAPKWFYDYTSDAKGLKTAKEGKLWGAAGLRFEPEDDGVFDLMDAKTARELAKVVSWRISPPKKDTLYLGKVACFYDVAGEELKLNFKVLFKDLEKAESNYLEKQIVDDLGSKKEPIFVVHSDTSLKKSDLRSFESPDDFRRHWQEITRDGGDSRYLILDNLVWVSKTPRGAQDKRRILIHEFDSRNSPTLEKWEQPNSVPYATSYRDKTDALFNSMRSAGLMDDKITSYELYWKGKLRPKIGTEMTAEIRDEIKVFHGSLIAASSNTKCTLTVLTSKGLHAAIKAAKSDGQYQLIGSSVVTKEIERASYRLQSWRNDKLTGETSELVDCTGKTATVTIEER